MISIFKLEWGEGQVYSYSLTKWILFFFFYCFVGWIWECFYVSVTQGWKTKKWKFINRGFLHGPMIPIYGFAAISILLTTLRLRENTLAVYIIGALTATLFEIVTGTVMEHLFKVKYWDYSNMPLNYHGHICLFVSLFWGLFSVFLVQVIHVPVESFLLGIPEFISEIAAFSLMIIFVYDTSVSFNEAMDLRDIIESLTEHNETIQRLERRVDAVIAFTSIPDMDELQEELETIKLSAKEALVYNVEKLRWKNEQRIDRMKERLQLPELEEILEKSEILEKLEFHRRRLLEKSNKQFLRAVNQLKRNPVVTSEKHKETLEMLKELLKNKKS